jgi:hypothetical protein
MYPSQAQQFLAKRNDYLGSSINQPPTLRGMALGNDVATAIIAMRAHDGSSVPDPTIGNGYELRDGVGFWRPDPISGSTLALGALWGMVDPFVLDSADQYRSPAPPGLDSLDYTTAFNEVKDVGGDGIVTTTARTLPQTVMGIY